jgi:glycosyltransferase involved in cell wall biosynthesis
MQKRVTAPESQRRKPRILWASVSCLLDTSSGASIDAREMLRQLSFHGCEVAVVGAMIFDSEKGVSRLPEHWKSSVEHKKLYRVTDPPLEHQLVVTKSLQRSVMTSLEADRWFGLYVHILESFRPDLVLFYGGQSLDLLISNEAKSRAIPVVSYIMNGNYNGERWRRDVDLIITNSLANADYYYRQDGIALTPVGLFIDSSAVTASVHTRRNLLFINPSIEKGAAIVIQLALLLEKRRPDILFEVVESRGKWQSLLHHISGQFGSPREQLDNVVLTTNTSDMRPLYGRARLLLAPSVAWECAGRVAAEAMLNGIPALVSGRGGLSEMIGNGGITVNFPEACYEKPYNRLPTMELLMPLVERIIQFYDDEALYNDYVAKARLVGVTLHHIDRSTQRLMVALQPLLEKRAGG